MTSHSLTTLGTWFNIWHYANVSCTVNRPELILSTLTDSIGIVTSIIRLPRGQGQCPVVTTLWVFLSVRQGDDRPDMLREEYFSWPQAPLELPYMQFDLHPSAGTWLFSSSFWSTSQLWQLGFCVPTI
jgi:hypothetical protein